jgi:hypothetical protein
LRIQEWIALTLAASLALPAGAQQTGSQLVQQSPPGELKIVVVEGEGAQNNIKSRSAVAPVVEIRDAEDKPVAGAEVTFQLPAGGPGGAFHGWLKTQTVRSDDKGRAAASGYAPNDEPGRFNIKVTATSGTKSGSLVVAQSNVAGSGKSAAGGVGAAKNTWWKWAAILGGAGIAGGVAAAVTGGDSTTTAKIPVTISAAPVTVGGPR